MTTRRRFALPRLARLAAVVVIALPLGGISSLEALFAPKSEPWPRWEAHDAAATAQIDHTAWDALLARYLSAGADGVNRFAYAAVTAADRAQLDRYVAALAAQPIDDFNRSEQLAFWVNLYNALTVQVVLAHYPVDSIRDIDISPGLFADGPWGRKLVTVAGEQLSLNDIEHRILRPVWRDPRIHYAVNCAAIGCPNLQPTAFTGSSAEAQLEAAARDYVNAPRGVRASGDGLVISSIYVWFKQDFGGSDQSIVAHLSRYADAELAATLQRTPRLTGHAYDWSLNDAGGATN